jgi:hypothetical protein
LGRAPADVARRGIAWLGAHQRDDGSWPGRSVNAAAALNQFSFCPSRARDDFGGVNGMTFASTWTSAR